MVIVFQRPWLLVLDKRMSLYRSLQSMYGYPADMVFTTAETFTNALIENLEPLITTGQGEV